MENIKHSNLKIGTIVSYASIIIEIVAGFFYVPWMVKQLGSSSYGIYSLAVSITTILSVDLGLTAAASKFIAKYRAEGNIEKANNLSSIIMKLFLIVDVIILVILLVVFALIDTSFSSRFTPDELKSFKVVFAIVGLYTILVFPTAPIGGFLNGNDRFTLLKIITLGTRLATIGLIVIGLLLGFGLYGFVIINCAVTVVSRIVQYAIFIKTNNYGNKITLKYWNKSEFKDVLHYVGWTALSVLSEKLIVYSVPYILGIFCGTDQISIFQIGLTIDTYLVTMSTAVDGFFIARLSKMDADNKDFDFTKYWIKVGRFQIAITLLFVLGFVIIGRGFVEMWMDGNEVVNSSSSYYVALFLMVPYILISTQQIGNTVLIIKDKVKYRAIGYVISSVLCVVLATLSVMIWRDSAAIVAAISILIGRTSFAIYSLFIFSKKINLNILAFLKETYVTMIPVAYAVFAIGYKIDAILPSNKWIYIIFKAVIIAVLYGFCLFFFWFKKEEKEYIFSFVKRRKK